MRAAVLFLENQVGFLFIITNFHKKLQFLLYLTDNTNSAVLLQLMIERLVFRNGI